MIQEEPLLCIKLINERAPLYKLWKNFESRNKVSRYFCDYFRKLIAKKLIKMLRYQLVSVFNRAMENPLMIVHRALRPHPMRRHTPATPTLKSPTTTLTPASNPSLSWCPSRKHRARENSIPGSPEGRNSEKIHPSTPNTAPATCQYARKYKNQKRDAVILQSEPKMKAALGQNVRVSLPKAKKQMSCGKRSPHRPYGRRI